MKKLFVILLALSLLCLCACTGNTQNPAQETTSATEEVTASTEAFERMESIVPWSEQEIEKPDFSGVDETKPNSAGVYEIYTAEGLQMLNQHPDASFRLLWDIDLQGAEWTPISVFNGTLDGAGYTISNFSVVSGKETGLISLNKGSISNLNLSDMTIVASEGMAGGIAARNEGNITDCSAAGTMTVSGNTVAGGLVGSMGAGELKNSVSAMNIRAEADTTVGLLAGNLENVTVTGCNYIGTVNTKADVLFTVFAGTETGVTYEECLWRDNTASDAFLDAENLQMRDQVIAKMRAMGTTQWVSKETIMYLHPSTPVGNGLYIAGMTYHGLPYTGNFGSYERFLYSLNEDGTLQQFIMDKGTQGADIFDMYMGCDCSGAVYWSWTQFSSTTEWLVTQGMIPSMGQGTVAIGEYDSEGMNDTMVVIKHNGEEVIAESYTQLHRADAIVTYYNNPDNAEDHRNHTRLVVDVVALRDQNGKLNLQKSYLITHGQGDGLSEAYASTWEIDAKHTFRELLDDQYIPISCQELVTGQAEPCVVTIDEPGMGKAYMSSGTVESNYRLISTTVTITDTAGNAVFDKTLFTSVYKFGDIQVADPMRETVRTFDLAAFAVYLKDVELTEGETYTYTVSAMPSTGENVVIKTFDITG